MNRVTSFSGRIAPRTYPNTYYDQLEGSGPFVEAVNKRVAEYWTATGHEMPIETASFIVMAEFYNRFHEENPEKK